jgi:hypothetical protein
LYDTEIKKAYFELYNCPKSGIIECQLIDLHTTNGMLMNYATQELTNSLQELTSKTESQPRKVEQVVPSSISARDFSFSSEVESFLEKTRDYSAKTQGVNVGTY